MNIEVGPTGSLVQGHLFDTDKVELERQLKRYDEQLYLKWDATRYGGYGTWQLRRRPKYKSIVDSTQLGGCGIHRLEYKEIDIENHVWDLPALSDSLLDRVKACDIWDQTDYQGKSHRIEEFTATMEQRFFDHKHETQQKQHTDMMYGIMQDRAVMKDFQERIVSGVDPRHLLRFWR